jgi:hypothetical protein
MKQYLLSTLLLAGVVGCSKKDDATPTIPANTLRLTLKGQQVIFPASAATLTISQKGTLLDLAAQAPDASQSSITLQAGSATSVEVPGFYSGDPYNQTKTGSASSVYGFIVPGSVRNPCGNLMSGHVTYQTGVIPAGLLTTNPDFTLTIHAVNTAAHTMSGTFAGTYWKGCDKLAVTDGQFNLPYTVLP